ncbi:MAG: complex I NDUFA9 subunit family protein, partial [Xanthomonadales bacterium]|nr:complex I NDUFA9 subunit family protein [Xanthomonadales bacterium]
GRGHRCVVLTRDPERCRELRLHPGVRLRRTNPSDTGSLAEALHGADAVVNLVGILNEKGRSGKGFHRFHVELVERLLEACRQAGVNRFLQVSALNAGIDDPNVSHYLKSKGEAERVIRESGIDYTIVRPSVIFGVDDSFFNRFAGLLKWIPVLPLACPGAGMQPVWVGDVAVAITRMLESREAIGQVYPLVGPKRYSLIELVRFTASAMGKKRWIVGLPDPVSRLQGLVCDFVPGKPFSSDNYRSLKIPNVSDENGLPEFGIDPRPLEGLVRHYLGGSSHQQRLDAIRKRSRGQS